MFGKPGGMNRRAFVQMAGAACLSGAVKPLMAQTAPTASRLENPMGLVVWIEEGQSIDAAIRQVHNFGFSVCQVGFARLTPEVATPLQTALSKYGVTATAFSEHGPGERIFDFYQGPETIGIIPVATRKARIKNLKLAADIASRLNIPAIHTHLGFTPEDPNNPLYPQTVTALREIASYCKDKGVIFLCELGQETPVTLVRLIKDVGTGNVFVNLDFANLISYGKGNPVDAMDVLGDRVRGTHVKDAVFPTGTWHLGKGAPLGQGKVDFPTVLAQLRNVNYTGPFLFEAWSTREDVFRRKAFLEKLTGVLPSSQGDA